jgi:hypothetical protein
MEDMENKWIALKLEELDTLPEGYKPNLTSKWDLLEASMENRNKHHLAMYKWLRAAAVVTGILLLGNLLAPRLATKPAAQTKEQHKVASALTPDKPHPNMEQKNKMTAVFVPHQSGVKMKNAKAKSNTVEMESVQPETRRDSIVTTQHSVPTVAVVTETPVKKEKNRYVQMDFNDPVDEGIARSADQGLNKKGFRIDLFNANAPPQTNTYTNSSTALFKIKF